ncbi:MAG: glycosyltransferase [Rhodospirillaceae bacterium]|nr:glycosyltransferase [Rhodospirillaceae bacterium]
MIREKLTVVSITYNHERFIKQTLESILMQKTNFKFKIIIGDDASTDETQKIILHYAEKHPDIIDPILRKINIGPMNNFIDTISMAKSKYVIYNEGDDYFNDPFKLQKQVDFLDSNPDFSLCFHPVLIEYENELNKNDFFPPKKLVNNKELNLEYLLKVNFIQTNSCMYRWRFLTEEKIKDVFPMNILPADHFLHLLHAETGKIGFIPDAMAVYRKWGGGIWAGAGITDAWFIKCGAAHIRFYKALEDHFHVDRALNIKKLAKKTLAALFRNHCWDEIQKFYQEFPHLYDSSLKKEKTHILPKNSIAYIKYRFLSKITFGRLRAKYDQKMNNLLRDDFF